MSLFPSPYFGYADGASRTSWNIAFIAWVIISPTNDIVSSGGIYLGPAMNNVAEYNVVIELMTEASSLGIHHLIVCLDSELVVSHLNSTYSIRHPILFQKYLRVRLLERLFHFISYEHIPRQFNSLADSLANFVLNWHLLH
jgi:ribonuclease HI